MHEDFDCKTYVPTVLENKEALGVYGTVVVIIGSLITLLLFVLFFEQVHFTYKNSQKVYRRHIYWIASIYPFMSLMSLLSVLVPRAHLICNSVKVTFMCMGIGHFADLTIEMFGGNDKMHETLKDKALNLQVQPACCCCRCLPSPPVTKRSVSYALYLVWILKWTQAFYYIVKYLWTTGLEEKSGEVAPSEVFLWLNIINFVSFLTGVYALQILCALCSEPLQNYRYRLKSLSMRLLILLTKFQSFILDIMGFYGAFPCLEDHLISRVSFKQIVENSLYLLEIVFAGLFTYYMYHTKEFNNSGAIAIADAEKSDSHPTPVHEIEGVSNENETASSERENNINNPVLPSLDPSSSNQGEINQGYDEVDIN